MDNRIEAALRKLATATGALKLTVSAVQDDCTHDDVAHAPAERMQYLDTLPPLFVCRNCGAWERGWASRLIRPGQTIGTYSCAEIPREDAYRIRQGAERAEA